MNVAKSSLNSLLVASIFNLHFGGFSMILIQKTEVARLTAGLTTSE